MYKKFKGGIAAGAIAMLSVHCVAVASTQVSGQVNLMRTHDASAIPSWGAPLFWFTLTGVVSVENCAKFSNGEVLIVGRDLQMMLFVMSALSKGYKVTVDIDAPETANGYCVARHITINKPV